MNIIKSNTKLYKRRIIVALPLNKLKNVCNYYSIHLKSVFRYTSKTLSNQYKRPRTARQPCWNDYSCNFLRSFPKSNLLRKKPQEGPKCSIYFADVIKMVFWLKGKCVIIKCDRVVLNSRMNRYCVCSIIIIMSNLKKNIKRLDIIFYVDLIFSKRSGETCAVYQDFVQTPERLFGLLNVAS